ncbi:hypothetical protein EPK84_24365 [Sinorhizobium fredii]|nr:hypothetical protein EPK84_24365 [Sinorhizobium fredii]
MLKILSLLSEYGRGCFSPKTPPERQAALPHHIPSVGTENRRAFRCRLSHWVAPDLKTEHKQSVKRA